MTTYTLGGGCFWCLDAVFRQLRGVETCISGYAGGVTVNPSYTDVSSGSTGHAEMVQVTFDEAVLPTEVLLDIYFAVHDPTTPNRQGNDVGTEYRSIMLYSTESEKVAYQAAIERASSLWNDTIITEVVPLHVFYQAEDYHQDFFNKNPSQGYCNVVINPKLTKVRRSFESYLV